MLGLGDEFVPGLEDPVGGVPHAAGDPDGAVVSEIPPDLSDDHGHAVGGKAHRLVDVKIVHRLDQAHASHLKEIVRVFTPAGKALNDRQYQPQISLDEILPGLTVSCLGFAQKLHGLLVFQNLELGRIDARDFDLSLHACCLLRR